MVLNINFTKNILDLGKTTNIPFIDSNELPVVISNVQDFFEDIVSIYFEALAEFSKYPIVTKSEVYGHRNVVA